MFVSTTGVLSSFTESSFFQFLHNSVKWSLESHTRVIENKKCLFVSLFHGIVLCDASDVITCAIM